MFKETLATLLKVAHEFLLIFLAEIKKNQFPRLISIQD